LAISAAAERRKFREGAHRLDPGFAEYRFKNTGAMSLTKRLNYTLFFLILYSEPVIAVPAVAVEACNNCNSHKFTELQ
jgi:hypothetical protein